jgi:hypothetical protein
VLAVLASVRQLCGLRGEAALEREALDLLVAAGHTRDGYVAAVWRDAMEQVAPRGPGSAHPLLAVLRPKCARRDDAPVPQLAPVHAVASAQGITKRTGLPACIAKPRRRTFGVADLHARSPRAGIEALAPANAAGNGLPPVVRQNGAAGLRHVSLDN